MALLTDVTIYRKPPKSRFTTEKVIALHEDVQFELEWKAFEIMVRAQESLVEHRQDGDARILIERGDVDKYVVLDDSRGMDAAMSIEFGRAGYIDPETGIVYDRMEPLNILSNAANLRKAPKIRAPKKKPLTPAQRKKLLAKMNKKKKEAMENDSSSKRK